MSIVAQNIRDLATRFQDQSQRRPPRLARKLAEALQWTEGRARVEQLSAPGITAQIARASVGSQPAAVFVSDHGAKSRELINIAALYAYHSAIEWGLVADRSEATVFNSHWVKDGNWFTLPPIKWSNIGQRIEVLEAITPSGLTQGRMDEVALKYYKPESLLRPVDDALVDHLDHWRDEALRYAARTENLDAKLQNIFAQLFVLRAVEDRNLAPQLATLESALDEQDKGRVDVRQLKAIFESAKSRIQSELFDTVDLDDIPEFVLNGIIRDLYKPSQLPGSDTRYNFAWIDADILGRAYEKYLSTLLIPSPTASPQIHMWDQPYRDVERVVARKASGVYYTPSYLVRYLTEQCLDRYFQRVEDITTSLPKIADISCGSGSFLTAAVDSLIRRLRAIDSDRNWGRELVSKRCIIGIDNDARAVTFARLQLWLRLAEEPEPLPLPRLGKTIIHGNSLREETWNDLPKRCDIILGNPPFIATGDIPSRKELAARFRTAQGRFDYSYLFVEMAVKKLGANGILGLVVPNRLFKNKDASTLRGILTSETDLATITDFGSNEVFAGISAYIGTFVTEKGAGGASEQAVRFTRVFSLPSRFVGALLAEANAAESEVRNQYLISYDAPPPHGEYEWVLLSASTRRARVRFAERSDPLSTIAFISQGIRTGANDIFIVDLEGHGGGALAYIRNGLGETHLIERAVLRPVIFGSDIRRYEYISPRKWLIYPYRNDRVILEAELRRDLPQTLKYFNNYRTLLTERGSIIPDGRFWYELSRQRSESWLNSKKLLIRDLATETSFAIDDTGNTYLVGGSAVIPADEQLLLPLLGYLNSGLVNWYLNQVTPSFRSEFQKFEPRHIEGVPVLKELLTDLNILDALTGMVRNVVTAKQSGDSYAQTRNESGINNLLCDIAGIDVREIL